MWYFQTCTELCGADLNITSDKWTQPPLNTMLHAVLLLHLTDALRMLSGHNSLALRFLFVCFSYYRATIENSSSHVLFSFTPLFVLNHFTVIVLVCLNPWDRIGLGREQDLFTALLKSWFCDFYGSSPAIFFPRSWLSSHQTVWNISFKYHALLQNLERICRQQQNKAMLKKKKKKVFPLEKGSSLTWPATNW